MKINEQWEELKEASNANIQSGKGILKRQIRSIQTEEKVYKEFMLYVIKNINKYHRFLHQEIQKFEGKTEQKTA